jgi:hypothetical protein
VRSLVNNYGAGAKRMALLTKKEFAHMCGMEQSSLWVYANQRKEIEIDGDYVDTDNPTNQRFLEKRVAKGKSKAVLNTMDLNTSPVYIPRTSTDKNPKLENIPEYAESEQLVKYWDSVKREKEVEKLQIEIDKKRGEVIPSDLMPPIVLQHNQSIITAIKNQQEEWLRKIGKRHNLTVLEVADAKSELIGWINEAMKKATRLTVSSLDNIVQDYAEKRGIGQREN